MLQFHFANPQAWGYPEGLAEELTQQLKVQGITLLASNEDGSEVYVSGSRTNQDAVWTLTDNGGEISVCKVNSGTLTSVAITSSLSAMPHDVESYALLIVVRLLAVFNGRSIDYQWRP